MSLSPHRFASDELKDSAPMVWAAVNENWEAFQHASPAIRGDLQMARRMVRLDGRTLQWMTEEIRNTPEVVMAAVAGNASHPHVLQWAGEAVKGDREIVLAAVQKHGKALQWAPEEMRNDHEIVLAAVTDRGEALQHASESLRDTDDVVLASVSAWGQSLRWASARLREDLAAVRAAVQDDIWAFNCATERGRTLPEVIDLVALYRAIQLRCGYRFRIMWCQQPVKHQTWKHKPCEHRAFFLLAIVPFTSQE